MTDLILKKGDTFEEIGIYDVIHRFISKFSSYHTRRRYKRVLTDFSEFISVKRLYDLRFIDFDELILKIRAYIDRSKNPRSRINTLNIIRSFFNYLVFVYNYPKNPVSKQVFHMEHQSSKSNTISLSQLDIMNLINHLKINKDNSRADYRDYLLIITMTVTSLRVSEVTQLRIDKISQDNITGNYFIEITQKGDRIRRILIPVKLYNEFKNYTDIYNITDFIFVSIKNNSGYKRDRLSQQGCFYTIRKRIYQYLGKSGFCNHSFRKTFIEMANRGGISPIAITKATGHSTLQMIKYYDTTDELENNATNDIAGLLL